MTTPKDNTGMPYWKRLPDEVILNEMIPYQGWRFIFDEKGIAHHVPDHETLKAMCDVYYKRADLASPVQDEDVREAVEQARIMQVYFGDRAAFHRHGELFYYRDTLETLIRAALRSSQGMGEVKSALKQAAWYVERYGDSRKDRHYVEQFNEALALLTTREYEAGK